MNSTNGDFQMCLMSCRMTTGSSHESSTGNTVSRLALTRPASRHLCPLMASWPSRHLASPLMPPSALLPSLAKTSLWCLAHRRSKAPTSSTLLPVWCSSCWSTAHPCTYTPLLGDKDWPVHFMAKRFLFYNLMLNWFKPLEFCLHCTATSHRRHPPNKRPIVQTMAA